MDGGINPPGASLVASVNDCAAAPSSDCSPTNSEFMRELLQAAPGGTHGWVVNFDGAPRPGANWTGMPYQGGGSVEAEIDTWGLLNTYMSVAAFFTSPDGEQGRRKGFFSRLLALVVDDVPDDRITGQVSWFMATSPGKNQCGIFLDGQDPDCENQALVDAVMRRFFEENLMGGDKSGNNSVRLVRLPIGTNHKPRDSGPFRHQVTRWNPGHRLSLDEACSSFGVDLDSCRQRVVERSDGSLQLGPSVPQDEKLAHLAGNIMRGEALHDSINVFAASLVKSGLHGGAAVNVLRGMMAASFAPRDARFQERYDDIPRAVRDGEKKFAPPLPAMPLAADVSEPEVIKPKLLIKGADLVANLDGVEWLIDGFLEAGAISVMFGPPGIGKSFVAFDQAFCVATGTKWHGRAVVQAPVIIVAGEGQAGAARRLAAWAKERGVDIRQAPIYFTRRSVPMLDQSRVLELVTEINEICAEHKMVPGLIVVDTLARNFGDGDENSTQDANAFIESLDTNLRLHFIWEGIKCHINIVHHSGLVGGRMRGSSVFKAAIDQEFSVTRVGDEIVYTNKKMKDAEEPAPLRFKLKKNIFLGNDRKGSAILGACLEILGNLLDAVIVVGKNGPVKAKDVLELMVEDKIPSVNKLVAMLGLSKNGVAAAIEELVAMGLIVQAEGYNGGYLATEAAKVALSQTGYQMLGGKVYDPNDEGEGDE